MTNVTRLASTYARAKSLKNDIDKLTAEYAAAMLRPRFAYMLTRSPVCRIFDSWRFLFNILITPGR